MKSLYGRSMRRAPLSSLRRWCSMKTSCVLSIGQLWEINMAKDSGGHGSEARGEKVAIGQAVDERHFPTRSPADLAAAKTLGQGHPKSAQVDTHPAMSIRGVGGYRDNSGKMIPFKSFEQVGRETRNRTR